MMPIAASPIARGFMLADLLSLIYFRATTPPCRHDQRVLSFCVVDGLFSRRHALMQKVSWTEGFVDRRT
jgi:hypothetical protein